MIVAINSKLFDYEKHTYINMIIYILCIYYLIIILSYIFIHNLCKSISNNSNNSNNSNEKPLHETQNNNQKIKTIRCFGKTKSGKRCKHRVTNQTEMLDNIHCRNHKIK